MPRPRFDVSLYGVLDPARCGGRPLAALADAALRGGVRLLQLRMKTATTRAFVDAARAVAEGARRHGVALIVNDRVDVALAAEAAGVHLGEDDMAPAEARRLLGGDAVIGVTIHSIAEAEAAPVAVADYFGVGAVHASASKRREAAPIGPEGLRRIRAVLRRRAADTPVVGIAGITAENAGAVIAAGADGIAVISALFLAPDVEAAARRLAAAVDRARGSA
jgi:thiamine-phosphate diphosphorylase